MNSQTKYMSERVQHVISTAIGRCNGRIDSYFSVSRITDLIFSFEKRTCDKKTTCRNMYVRKGPKNNGYRCTCRDRDQWVLRKNNG